VRRAGRIDDGIEETCPHLAFAALAVAHLEPVVCRGAGNQPRGDMAKRPCPFAFVQHGLYLRRNAKAVHVPEGAQPPHKPDPLGGGQRRP